MIAHKNNFTFKSISSNETKDLCFWHALFHLPLKQPILLYFLFMLKAMGSLRFSNHIYRAGKPETSLFDQMAD